MPQFSIIICTYNRAEYLDICLNSLVSQDLKDVEIIVIDNNSRDHTADVIDKYQNTSSAVRGFKEVQQGLSYARNRGLIESKSDWLVFLDDDAFADQSYIQELRKQIHKKEFECFGGIYLPWYRFGKKNWYKDSYSSNTDKNFIQNVLNEDSFIDGGNCVFSKALLNKLGGFNVEIGMKGNVLSYGEETELQKKIRAMGIKIGFNTNIVIYHLVPLHKQSVRWMLISSYSNGKNYWSIFQSKPTIFIILKMLIGGFIQIFKSTIKVFKKVILNKEKYPQNVIIEIFGPLAYRIGQINSGIKGLK